MGRRDGGAAGQRAFHAPAKRLLPLFGMAVLVATGVMAAGTAAKPKTAALPKPPAAPKPLPPPVPVVKPPSAEVPAEPPPGNEIMPVSQVRAGMKGYGLTVFRGTKLERFDVEVVSVLPKANMGQPLILVRLSGGPISQKGAFLIRGMSGSPVYVDGKLLGAFSQGNAWPKEALGMVTPIEDMMEALDPKLSEVPAGETALDLSAPAKVVADAGDALPSLFKGPEPTAVSALGQTFKPMALPVTVSGLSGRNLDRLGQILAPFNMAVAQGPGSMDQPLKTKIQPGAAIGVALMTGDIEMTGIGTITYCKGDKLLAFGHPMMQIGAAGFPITTAYIHDVFPGFEVSHKIGSAGEIIGTLTQDRPWSIAGRLGPAPKMVPVDIHVADEETGRKRDFNVQVCNHPLLVSQLVPTAVNQGLFTVRPVPGDVVARVKLTAETEGAGTIRRENVFYDPAQIDVTSIRELQELMSLLAVNSFGRVPVKRLSVDVTLQGGRPMATLERVFLAKNRFEPGDEVEVGAVVRPYRKEPVVVRTKVRVPENAGSGRALVMVQGGGTRINLGPLLSGGNATGGFSPLAPPPTANLGQMIRRFVERERGDQLVTRIVFPTASINVGGRRLSQLPSYLVDIMRSSKTTGFRIERDVATSMDNSDYIIEGVQTLEIGIQRPDHQEKPAGAAGGAIQGGLGGTILGGEPSRAPLSVDEDADDLSVLRFLVDGKPRIIRLTPEEDEPEATPEEIKGRDAGKTIEKKPVRKKSDDAKAAPPAANAPPDSEERAVTPRPEDKPIGRPAKLWTQTTQADFERGTMTNTAVTSTGEVQLAPSLHLVHESSEQFIWGVAGIRGVTYAGTGNGGRLLKVEGDMAAEAMKSGELMIHALARDASGNLYAGTSPSGKLLRIAPDGKTTELLSLSEQEAGPDPGTEFVLSLVVGADGTVYAGTGPTAKIYRVKPGDSQARLYATLTDSSVTALALAKDGTLYAGTAEDGAVYRIPPSDGPTSATVLFDSAQTAITGLAFDRAGNVCAATAPLGQIYRITPAGTATTVLENPRGSLYGLLSDAGGNLYTASANTVLRIEPDGNTIILTDRRNGQFTCLAWDDQGRLIAGSSNTGSVYRIEPSVSGTFESTIHDAKTQAKWGRLKYTGLAPDGAVVTIQTRSGNSPEPDATWSAWAATTVQDGSSYVASPPARFLQYRVLLQSERGAPSLRDIQIAYMPRNQAPTLKLTGPTGGEIVRGSLPLKWSATDPDGDTLTYEVAYSADGGRTWKPVGEAGKDGPKESKPALPKPSDPEAARKSADEALKRYRATLEADMSLTPAQRDEAFDKAKGLIDRFLKEGPPTGPDASEPPRAANSANGSTRTAGMNWDTKGVPDGLYLLRVIASDKASSPDEPLTDIAMTEPIIVANTPPQLFVFEKGIMPDAKGASEITGFVAGRVSLRGAQFRIGNGDWTAVVPDDGIWDSAFEHFRFNAQAPESGDQVVELRVFDVAGNSVGSKVKLKSKMESTTALPGPADGSDRSGGEKAEDKSKAEKKRKPKKAKDKKPAEAEPAEK